MPAFWQQLLSDDQPESADPPTHAVPSDGELLDAFSRTVVDVAELLRPAGTEGAQVVVAGTHGRRR